MNYIIRVIIFKIICLKKFKNINKIEEFNNCLLKKYLFINY